MPSEKHNSIMAKATGLISSLFNVASSGDVPFHQPQQFASRSLLLFSFELYSFIHCRIGDDLQFVHYGFGARLG